MVMRIKGYLNETSVLEIFAARPRPSPVTGAIPPSTAITLALAEKYRVSNKTIRDIWKRKSWIKVTAAWDEASQSPVSDFDLTSPAQHEPATPDSEFGVEAFPGFSTCSATQSCAHLEDDIDALPSGHHPNPFDGDWEAALSSIQTETRCMAEAGKVGEAGASAPAESLEWSIDHACVYSSREQDSMWGAVESELEWLSCLNQ